MHPPAPAASGALQNLISRLRQTVSRSREGRQVFQTGESALAEAKDHLTRMAELAQKAADGTPQDRAAIQKELSLLSKEIDRLLKDASFQGTSLFQQEEAGTDAAQVYESLAQEMENLSRALLTGTTASGETAIPRWLLQAMMGDALDRSSILAYLHLDESATAEDILKALSDKDIENDPVAGRLAALYLGAVISGGGTPSETVDMTAMLEGLQRLMEKVADGLTLDQAIQELTNGTFTGLLDFELQFSSGGQILANFLSQLLLPAEDSALLAGMGGAGMETDFQFNLDLALDLLIGGASTLFQHPETGDSSTAEAHTMLIRQFAALQAEGQDLSGVSFDASTGTLTVDGAKDILLSGTALSNSASEGTPVSSEAQTGSEARATDTAQTPLESGQTPQTRTGQTSSVDVTTQVRSSLQTGSGGNVHSDALHGLQARTDTGVSPSPGAPDVSETAASTPQAGQNTQMTQSALSGQAAPSGLTLLITGSGTVTLRDIEASQIVVDTAQARLSSEGKNTIDTLLLRDHASVVLEGKGTLDIGALQGDGKHTLVLTSGAITVDKGNGEVPSNISAVLDGPVSLAAQAGHIHNANGVPLEPYDISWGNLPADWASILAISVNGQQGKMNLFEEAVQQGAIHLWLQKEAVDPSHGYPIHLVSLYGRESSGRLRTRYTYVQWQERARAFQEVSMYPNPFAVTGGSEGEDWEYDEATQTLRILTAQVMEVSGGTGVDANDEPFSGRLALAGHIGEVTLTVNGVDCQVSSGRAFELGRENQVTLLLGTGTNNTFISGTGCAGISLGDGTLIHIDAAPRDPDSDPELPVGTLTCMGGSGGAGIGRDSCGGWDRISQIHIHGGTITAVGGGGGAGIGAGKHGFMGPVTITGGAVTATGGTGGGAGIGGGLGAPVGDIAIRGGRITAQASYHAAAIGAGIQGESGDIRITGTAHIVRAQGGDPGADIGACIFGKCGEIVIAGGADVGSAAIKRWTPDGIRLEIAGKAVTLPRFHLSAELLRLNQMDVSTPEGAQAAQRTIHAAGRRISGIQATYHTLNRQLERTINELMGTRESISAAEHLIRDTDRASTLLTDAKRSILRQSSQATWTHGGHGVEEVRRLLW